MINKKFIPYIILTVIAVLAIFTYLGLKLNDVQDVPPVPQEAKEEVTLYFADQDAMYLVGEIRQMEKADLYLTILKELIKGPQSPTLNRTIPDGVEVLSIKVNDKIAIIDFNQAFIENHWGGSTGERMTVYSIVNTITQFAEISSVRFLVAGEKIDTLAGHMDLSIDVERNEEIIKQEKK